MAKLYILCGSSGCGKTTLMNSMTSTDLKSPSKKYNAVRAPKYSERDVRKKKGEIDDITHVDKIDLNIFSIAYAMNHTKYALKYSEIKQILNKGINVFVVVSDLRAIRHIKNHFNSDAKAIYVSSDIDAERLKRYQLERQGFMPDIDQKYILSNHFVKLAAISRLGWWERVTESILELEKDWHSYATDSKSTKIRIQRIRATHIRYIEHLSIFDHVILNYTEGKPEEMIVQMENIMKSDTDTAKNKKKINFPPIFIVTAASGAGKGTLMEMLNLIGSDNISIVSKLATREPKNDDKRDGMIALSRNQDHDEPIWPKWWNSGMKSTAGQVEFPEEYDLRWDFHNCDYAVSSKEINKNLEKGISQIFVSNMGQIANFKKKWPDNCVFIYLHRLNSAEDHRKFIENKWKNSPDNIEERIREKIKVHNDYIDNIAEIHHVLLNTSFEEDLHEQMFNLIRYYQN